jgi:hypothetical protein
MFVNDFTDKVYVYKLAYERMTVLGCTCYECDEFATDLAKGVLDLQGLDRQDVIDGLKWCLASPMVAKPAHVLIGYAKQYAINLATFKGRP